MLVFERNTAPRSRVAEFEAKIRAMYAELARESDKPGPPPEPGRGTRKDKTDAPAKRDLAKLLGGFDPTTLDGVDYALAAAIVAETGTDLSMFQNEAHFVSYAGLKPSLGKSAGKNVRTGRKAKNTSQLGQYFRGDGGAEHATATEQVTAKRS